MQSIAASLPEAICYIDMDLPEAEDDYLGLYGLIEQGKQESRGYEQRKSTKPAWRRFCIRPNDRGKVRVMLSPKSILAASRGGLSLLEIGKVCLSVLPVHHFV